MSKMSHRIFAMTMAVVFTLSAVAFSAFVIYDMRQGSKNSDLAQTQAEIQQQQAQNKACPQSGEAEALPAPEVYKPADKVSEIQKDDLEPGNGAEAKSGDCLIVKYYGTLASDGTMFDETFTKPSSFGFTLGQGSVIQGWDQGLVGMKAGGTRRLVIPADKAYGSQPSGKIPANSDLVFVVKLLEVKTK